MVDSIDTHPVQQRETHPPRLIPATETWGAWDVVSLYLDRCRIDTPDSLVRSTWDHVHALRSSVGTVLDLGAGDGRFARYGKYDRYIGYEIDQSLRPPGPLPPNATIRYCCAFSETIDDADLCIGNPPFVRNQDLPLGWRLHAANELLDRTGVTLSGLANAWQYFFLLALASINADGLCALIVPYEWVSRPSASALRSYIHSHGWAVSVYRLVDTTFNSVLTTSSITVVDKATRKRSWTYFHEYRTGTYTQLQSATGAPSGVIPYTRRAAIARDAPYAMRGLSPGTQKVLTLTEAQRIHFGLLVDRDVVPCVTTLRPLAADVAALDREAFLEFYVVGGHRCWLIRTDGAQSTALAAYLAGVPSSRYQTTTCAERKCWWKFRMPTSPDALVSMSFKGKAPKATANDIHARAVGGVYGVYNLPTSRIKHAVALLRAADIRGRLVAHANGLRKIEVNQLNTLLTEILPEYAGSGKGHRA